MELKTLFDAPNLPEVQCYKMKLVLLVRQRNTVMSIWTCQLTEVRFFVDEHIENATDDEAAALHDVIMLSSDEDSLFEDNTHFELKPGTGLQGEESPLGIACEVRTEGEELQERVHLQPTGSDGV
jgi:hypothetical protein